MPLTVTLTLVGGADDGKQFLLRAPNRFIVGRAGGCYPRLPSDPPYVTVSRSHCLLHLDPPHLGVIDLGSRNGTFVNGVRVGRAEADDAPCPLQEGDELRVGEIVFRVNVAEAEGGREDGSGITGREALTH